MTEPLLENTVRRHRVARGWSQQTLADLVEVSRQAIIAVESGRQVPSTALGLKLASALGCTVEELFTLIPADGLEVRLARGPDTSARVAVGEVEGRWVAHRLSGEVTGAADGVLMEEAQAESAVAEKDPAAPPATARVRPLASPDRLRRNVLVAGCAPVLGALVPRVGARFGDARATWLAAGSMRALELLEGGLVHVAGMHFPDSHGEDNASMARRALPGARILLANLTRWRQGLIVARGNPLGIRSAADLLRPGLRFARREEGAGADKLVRRLLEAEGVRGGGLSGPLAAGHADVARLVGWGAADVGVAVEGVALAADLDFIPLAEESFDLVVRADLADTAPVSRLLDALDAASFRGELAALPGYDGERAGHVVTVESA